MALVVVVTALVIVVTTLTVLGDSETGQPERECS
jgi:hypothetical protein